MPLSLLFQLCLLRARPQDLSVSRAGMFAVLVVYGVVGAVSVLDALTLRSAVMAAATDTLLLAAAVHLALQWRRLENRITQTLTAVAGSGALLSLSALVVAGLMRAVLPSEWVWAGFFVWYTLVFGHVLRHALSISLTAGVAAALVYMIFSLGVTGLFMEPVPTTD